MKKVKLLLFDVDGVITDGKVYVDTNGTIQKCYSLKDLDSLTQMKKSGYRLGCISGERAPLEQIFLDFGLDYIKMGCKDKKSAIMQIAAEADLSMDEIAYIGDGKYDLEALAMVGTAICPSDAIREAREIADILLKSRGGDGCISEICSMLTTETVESQMAVEKTDSKVKEISEHDILGEMEGHKELIQSVINSEPYIKSVQYAISMIEECYDAGHRVYICGNGGSAADAQHIAGELVGRFHLERVSLPAEALSTDTSILTSLANDYDYETVFSRQLEGKGKRDDILVGITTSGSSKNILKAFQMARKVGMKTILLTGDIDNNLLILQYTDCCIAVPSKSTPRIQEIHMLTYHTICRIVEEYVAH